MDEAHKFSAESLEEVRLLMNFETAERKLLQVVLAGQNELRELMRREDLRQLRQRVSVRLDIVPVAAGRSGAVHAAPLAPGRRQRQLPFQP